MNKEQLQKILENGYFIVNITSKCGFVGCENDIEKAVMPDDGGLSVYLICNSHAELISMIQVPKNE